MSVNDLNALETKFYSSLGNGVNAGGYLRDIIRATVDTRDTTILVKAITRAEKKGDTQAANIVRFVARQVFPEAKTGKTKTGTLTIKISGVKANPEALNRLDEAVERKLSIRAQTFRKVIKPEEKTDKEFDLDAWAKRQIKAHPGMAASMAAALQRAEREQSISH